MAHVGKTSEWYSVGLGTLSSKLALFEVFETVKATKKQLVYLSYSNNVIIDQLPGR